MPRPRRIHAADVLQTVHMVCMRGGLREQGVVEDLSSLACYLAAVVHDFEHKGVNNDYLVRAALGWLGWLCQLCWGSCSGACSRSCSRGMHVHICTQLCAPECSLDAHAAWLGLRGGSMLSGADKWKSARSAALDSGHQVTTHIADLPHSPHPHPPYPHHTTLHHTTQHTTHNTTRHSPTPHHHHLQVRVSDSLAILYNDRSPMENHHLAASFDVLNQDDYNFAKKVWRQCLPACLLPGYCWLLLVRRC
jgi:hypothetical protein